MSEKTLKLSVKTFRDEGLEARWSKTNHGAPIIVCRDPKAPLPHQRETWWMVTRSVWDCIQKNGVVEGFRNATLLGNIFSI